MLFIDGSADNQLKVGCGAYLVVHENNESELIQQGQIKIKKFADTSSSKLELQTLLWALGELNNTPQKVIVFTDSQNIIGLLARRRRLEQNDYHSGRNKRLKHHALYREFFEITDQMNCGFVKVDGHQPSKNKENHDHLFTLVDRAARKALRNLKD